MTGGRLRFIALLWGALALLASSAGAAPYSLIVTGSGGTEPYHQKFAGWGARLVRALHKQCGHPHENIVWLADRSLAENTLPATGRAEPAAALAPASPAMNDPAASRVLSASKVSLSTRPAAGVKLATGIAEPATIAIRPNGTAKLNNIQSHIESFNSKHSENDVFFVYLIGHGSYLAQKAKFHLPGPDLTAKQLDEWLRALPAKNLVVLNAASSSAAYINTLSGEGRVIATATRNTEQIHATEFMEFFLQALEEGSADQNHDERITVWEACRQAAQLTEGWYEERGYMVTENAILDDNGDGLGTRLFEPNTNSKQNEKTVEDASNFHNQRQDAAATNQDGALAQQIFLKDFVFPEDTPQVLIDTYLSLLDRIEALKAEKSAMDERRYYQRLESLLIDAAHANRMIHAFDEQPAQTASNTPPAEMDDFPTLQEIDFSN